MANHASFDCRATAPDAETQIVACYQNPKTKEVNVPKGPMADLVKRVKSTGAFNGSASSSIFLPFQGEEGDQAFLLVGLGEEKKADAEVVRRAGAAAWEKLTASRTQHASVEVSLFGSSQPKQVLFATALAEGMALSGYTYDKKSVPAPKKKAASKKEEENSKPVETIVFTSGSAPVRRKLSAELTLVEEMRSAVNLTRTWSNLPPNIGTPKYFADESAKLAKQYGLKCKILTEADAKKEGMHLLLSVGQGSKRESRVVVLEYTPKKKTKKTKTLALVGKGVTFDSGGISIKPSSLMEEMKHDMTGAATMVGATLLAARAKSPCKIITVLGFVENMPSGEATTPGSVITSRSGKSVEIINTDAEGRLVLVDLLDYAQEFKPDAMINAATLTGAVLVALGRYCCGMMSNNDKLASALEKSAAETQERMWRLPLYEEYGNDMKSDYADLKNSNNDRMAGTIRAGAFMQQFIKDDLPWAHLDIAATAWDLGYLPYHPKKGGSGAHVRALAHLAANFK